MLPVGRRVRARGDASEGHCLAARATHSPMVRVRETDKEQDGYDFRTFCESPRAIVVRFSGDVITGIRVVTTAEFERIMLVDKPFQGREKEQWIVLAADERVEQVAVRTSGGLRG